MRLWKLYCISGFTTANELFDNIKIVSDNGLRELFEKALDNGDFEEETMVRYNKLIKADKNWFDDIIEIADMFYYDGYAVQCIEIDK